MVDIIRPGIQEQAVSIDGVCFWCDGEKTVRINNRIGDGSLWTRVFCSHCEGTGRMVHQERQLLCIGGPADGQVLNISHLRHAYPEDVNSYSQFNHGSGFNADVPSSVFIHTSLFAALPRKS